MQGRYVALGTLETNCIYIALFIHYNGSHKNEHTALLHKAYVKLPKYWSVCHPKQILASEN